MNRQTLDKYISQNYNTLAEYPWPKYPDYAVYRHQSNRKWFAVVMGLPKSKLGLSGDGIIDVVNLKCDPLLIGSLLNDEGIYPGYHMNKSYWITLCLDGSVDADKVKWLLDLSFDLTYTMPKRKSAK
ncbi:MAG: MmcQ/YjbR family DNA-binding protein [Clostridia bacterium]|nr:MmcQ/YjbR family DNA-binding protein [Clostridia bacterium]